MSYIVGFLVILIGISISILFEKKKTNANSTLFNALAEHFGGTFQDAKDIRKHRVTFEHLERQITLGRFRPDHKRDDVSFVWFNATITIDAIAADHHMAIYAETLKQSFQKLAGAEDLIINQDAFDKAFIVQCSDPTWIRLIMTKEVCDAHLKQRKFAILLKEQVLTIELHHNKTTIEELKQMVDLLELYAKCIETYTTAASTD